MGCQDPGLLVGGISNWEVAPLLPRNMTTKMTIREFQDLIERIYYDRDSSRGLASTFMWFIEEVGELAQALRSGDRKQLADEFSDVLAWLATTASIAGIDLEQATQKYAGGCPKCGQIPCTCPEPGSS